MKFRSPLVFEIICIGTFDLWVYGIVDIGLFHYGDDFIAKVSVENRVNNGWIMGFWNVYICCF